MMNRRDFLVAATGAVVATPFAARQQAQAGPIRTVRTNILEIAYHEVGDPNGFPVILLHGFPDDAHAYDGVGPLLRSEEQRLNSSHT